MKLVLSCVLLARFVFCTDLKIDPLVIVEQGVVRGQIAVNGDYCTFLGIPYAQVDLDNPFGPAQRPSAFEGILNANDGSQKCPQNPEDSNESLDCLKLNVYVPNKANSQNPLPVLVWIHGGGFASRSAGDFKPLNLVKLDVIIVTINYRLGPYGFMCLDDPSVPGNQGIKDQYEALLWIRSNIAAFGGNPYNVTLGGESAGSACVLYHLYSNKEKLYNKIIVQSDTPQNEGMFVKKNINAAIQLAEALGYSATNTTQALDFLSKVSPNLVIGAAQELNLKLKPCRETFLDGVSAIVENQPLSLSNARKVKNTPILIGHTTKEHMGVLLEMYGEDYLNSNPFYEKLKDHFNLDHEELVEAAEIVRHFYIGDEPVSVSSLSVLEDFDSDFVFNHPVQRTITNLLHENAGPVYQYLFSYTGDEVVDGAPHAAENNYLFESDFVPQNVDDQLIVDRMTTMWSNFIKYGNPTPEVSDLLPVTWIPSALHTRPYLNIDLNMSIEHRVYKQRMSFWDLSFALYGKYNVYSD